MKNIGLVERETVHEQVYSKLSEALLDGQFAPGDTMQIRKLAAVVGTSSMPVRDALRTLVAERALVLLPNRTVAVPELTQLEIQELTMLRSAVEGIVSAKAVENISDTTIEKLQQLNTSMHDAITNSDIKEYLRLNRDFHFSIYEASGFHTIIDYIKLTWLRVGPVFNYLLGDEWNASNKQSTKEETDFLCGNHELAIEGLKCRDAEKVQQAITADIAECGEYLATLLEKQTSISNEK